MAHQRGAMLFPWQQDDDARFAEVAWFHHGFPQVGPQTLCDPGRRDQTDCENISFRTSQAYARSLGRLWPPRANATARLIYLDVGAHEPFNYQEPYGPRVRGRTIGNRTRTRESSMQMFWPRYPHGEAFATFAFEGDPSRAAAWQYPRVVALNATFVPAAVSTFDGDGHFGASGLGASLGATADKAHQQPTRVIDFARWLEEKVRHDDWVVCKLDVEKSEFELIPHLLRRPSTLRLIDELFIECHHKETWSNGPHRRSECVQMARNLQAAGVWTHGWF